ncbi:MAG: hypothetical protein ABSG37_08460 [Candidatus Limnocylindrales bacterium]|jgi:hypothetical protein
MGAMDKCLKGAGARAEGFPYHTILYETPNVYHDHPTCPRGMAIRFEHLRRGKKGRDYCRDCAGKRGSTT